MTYVVYIWHMDFTLYLLFTENGQFLPQKINGICSLLKSLLDILKHNFVPQVIRQKGK